MAREVRVVLVASGADANRQRIASLLGNALDRLLCADVDRVPETSVCTDVVTGLAR
jgi:hypothetical protein